MVYEIRPHANHLNRMIDLEYEQAPTARSWMDYTLKEEPVAEGSAPILIRSEHPQLPDAFEISRDFWCVSVRVRELMQKLYGSQVTFYEVPVTAEEDSRSLPSTNFVTFSQFCELIDWQKSKVQVRKPARPDTEVIALADAPDAAVFKDIPSDRRIWIERSFRKGNRLFSPGFNVYTTDAGAKVIGEAFPGVFILRKQREDHGIRTLRLA